MRWPVDDGTRAAPNRRAELVKLRLLAGLSFDESAATLGIAVPAAKQRWACAPAAASDNGPGRAHHGINNDLRGHGEILPEPLTSRPPFEADQCPTDGITGPGTGQRDNDAVPPGTRFAALRGRGLLTAAQQRSAQPATMMQALHGDLNSMVMRCLGKDGHHGYQTAGDLAHDLHRYLGNEPESPRPGAQPATAAMIFPQPARPAIAGVIARRTGRRRNTRPVAVANLPREVGMTRSNRRRGSD